MRLVQKTGIALILVLIQAASLPAYSQQTGDRTAETSASVPALKDFHTVIFKIWHTAWPNKDYAMLASLVPEVQDGVAAVAAAELPGILREKKDAWAAGVATLQSIASAYKAAADGNKQQELLDAAERLHAQYEALVRLLRPPMKELEDFHATLYMLYHYYMPQDSTAQIKASVVQLQQKMTALENATLPERFAAKTEAFTKARNDLGKAVRDLAATVPQNNAAATRDAVELMHSKYETLADILK